MQYLNIYHVANFQQQRLQLDTYHQIVVVWQICVYYDKLSAFEVYVEKKKHMKLANFKSG